MRSPNGRARLRGVLRLRSVLGLSLLANQFPALHGLRVLAILTVIQIHLSTELATLNLLPRTSTLYAASQRLWFGMDLFFFLSGFLIGTILLTAAGSGGILRFYARRGFRIVPLYYVVLTALAAVTPLDPVQRVQLPREYLYLTNYSDITHSVMFWGWSLCVEEHFYLAVPLLIALLACVRKHWQRIAALTVLWLSGAVARVVIALTHDTLTPSEAFQKLYIPTHARYDILIAGILLAYLLRTEGERIRRAMATTWIRVASAALTIVLFGMLLATPLSRGTPGLGLMVPGTITGLAYLNLFAYLLTRGGTAAEILGSRALLPVATLGYGVYLVHVPVVRLAGLDAYARLVLVAHLPITAAFLTATLVVFAESIAIAYVLHLFIEKPALWLRDRVAPAARRVGPITAEVTAAGAG